MGPRTLIAPFTVQGEHFHLTTDGRVQCDLCPRHCRMHDGQKGFCYVREARDNTMVLTSYGRASGFCVDPIEKKPLNHFYPGSAVLSFGTAGCNLGCRFCQNWDISKARSDDRLTDVARPEAVARTAQEHGVTSLAFTYNDPVIFAEYADDCAQAAHALGLRTVAVTAGYIGERARPSFFANMDAANVDLKAFTDGFYEKLCFAKLAPVLDTLVWLKRESAVWLEVTTLLIPDLNDSNEELAQLCTFFARELGADTPLHFTAFHPDFKLQDKPATPHSTLRRAREIALSHGLTHVYLGNVRDPEGQTTSCAQCAAPLITRDGYTLQRYRLTSAGACPDCGKRLAGHFAERAGSWGARRMRLPIVERSAP